MTRFRKLSDLGDLSDRIALVRVDLNVPMQDGAISDDTRIRAFIPTVRTLRAKGARVVLLSHFDRPKGRRIPEMSLAPLVAPLSAALGEEVVFGTDCIGEAAEAAIAAGAGVTLLENLRFHPGEEANDPVFARALARLGDIYVNDAFSAAHRAHASTEALAHLLPACAGESMAAELEALERALGAPERPVMAIVGGAKVSTKLDALTHLVEKVDHLVIGGGMANSFLFAQGHAIGISLAERDLADTARAILACAREAGCVIHLPVDGLLATEFRAHAPHRIASVGDIRADEMMLDIGPESVAAIVAALEGTRTLIWNGPLGAFEIEPFGTASFAIAREVARLTRDGKLLSVAGGGDTVAALNMAGVAGDLSHVSTAGGAFLEWMEGKTLPGVAALAAR
ncbi:MAG: phosphoglycerate kinase [Rhodothalassiaceae bacterium]